MKRTYVKVRSDFDETGFVVPKYIIWGNKVLPIEDIRDFKPADSPIGHGLPGSCYVVVIQGEEKHLFFQKTDPRFSSRVGRWFVESTEET